MRVHLITVRRGFCTTNSCNRNRLGRNVLLRFAILTFFNHSPRFMIVSLHFKIMHQDFSSISEIYDSLVAMMKLLRLKISLLLFITYMV